MPKPKPDEVIRHEIVLGRTEKDLLEEIAQAYRINKIATPVIDALANPIILVTVTGTAIIVIDQLLELLGVSPDWKELTQDLPKEEFDDWLETQNLVGGTLGAILGAVLLGPFGIVAGGLGAVAGGLGGAVAVEGIEAGVENVSEGLSGASTGNEVVAMASALATISRGLSNAQEKLSESADGFRDFVRGR